MDVQTVALQDTNGITTLVDIACPTEEERIAQEVCCECSKPASTEILNIMCRIAYMYYCDDCFGKARIELKQPNTWNDVNDCLPDKDGHYLLIMTDGRYLVGEFDIKYSNWYDQTGDNMGDNMDFWHPIPERPKQVSGRA